MSHPCAAQVLALGASVAASTPQPAVDPTQVAVIMYTSGSTGKPKGVMLKHESILASISGCAEVLGPMAEPGDTYLGYLPQAHILEFCAELTCLALGMNVGYADPRTLTSTGAVARRGPRETWFRANPWTSLEVLGRARSDPPVATASRDD